MSIIEEKYFSDTRLDELDERYSYSARHIIERTIYAFELLAQIRVRKDDFIFKGGTSLLLVLSGAKRLSIDIDLIGFISDKILKDITRDSVFHRYIEIERRDDDIPLRQYKFYYDSRVSKQEMPVKLDVLNDRSDYESIYEKSLASDLAPAIFDLSEDLDVSVPGVEDILADKLTAFAPNTIGIRFKDREENSRGLEIIKQLFDIGQLFDEANNLNTIKAVYRNIARRESGYRDGEFSIEESLWDTIHTARDFSLLNFERLEHSEEMMDLKESRERISEYLISKKFILDEATISAGKAALLAVLILSEKGGFLDKFRYGDGPGEDGDNVEITKPFSALKRLYLINREAYYYWSKAVRILRENKLLD